MPHLSLILLIYIFISGVCGSMWYIHFQISFLYFQGSEGDEDIGGKTDQASSSNNETQWNIILDYKKSEACAGTKKVSLTGRDIEMIELCQYITNSHYKVMSVWGIAGVGKSALLTNLFIDRILYSKENIFHKYGWVDVSHPFNLRDFSRSLLWSFRSRSIQGTENENHSNKNPIQECQEILEQGHCLVVIDDVQSKEEWDLIQDSLVNRSSNNVIVVITTEASIATYCADKEELVYNVKSLDAGAAFDLFKEVRFLTKKLLTSILASLFYKQRVSSL